LDGDVLLACEQSGSEANTGSDSSTDAGPDTTSGHCSDGSASSGACSDEEKVVFLVTSADGMVGSGADRVDFAVESEGIECQTDNGSTFEVAGAIRLGDMAAEEGAIGDGLAAINEQGTVQGGGEAVSGAVAAGI